MQGNTASIDLLGVGCKSVDGVYESVDGRVFARVC